MVSGCPAAGATLAVEHARLSAHEGRLVHLPLRLRNAFREALVGFYLGAIDDLFTAEGFCPAQPAQTVRGERRTRTEEYYGSVDWNSAPDCQRVLRVFEGVLSQADDSERERLVAALARDGFRVGGQGQIVAAGETLEMSQLDLRDDSALTLHIGRILHAVDERPEEAIGAAKDLIESASKYVLEELGEDLSGGEDLPQLVRKVQKALGLHPENVAPDRKGAEGIRRILGALATQAVAVAELRNLYGTGHGRSRRVTGLRPRHARLVARAAQAYVGFVLETLADPSAPWRAREPAVESVTATSDGRTAS